MMMYVIELLIWNPKYSKLDKFCLSIHIKDLVKFKMCTLDSRVHITFYILKRTVARSHCNLKGLKMTFRTKILRKNYTTLINLKNTTNFVLPTFL